MGNSECRPVLHNIQHLEEAIQKKHDCSQKGDPPQKFSPHTAHATIQILEQLHWEFPVHPPYSPFHLVHQPLKSTKKGKKPLI
jgi:hypothetical protein